jgi:hypothetical protein
MTTSTTNRPIRSRFGSLIRQLWFQVVVGAIAGIAVGILLPDIGAAVSPLNDWFIGLVKMIGIDHPQRRSSIHQRSRQRPRRHRDRQVGEGLRPPTGPRSPGRETRVRHRRRRIRRGHRPRRECGQGTRSRHPLTQPERPTDVSVLVTTDYVQPSDDIGQLLRGHGHEGDPPAAGPPRSNADCSQDPRCRNGQRTCHRRNPKAG